MEHSEENCSEEVDIEGFHTIVTVRSLDDYRIYSIVSPEFEENGDMANLLMSVGIELKNSLSVYKMASSLLLPYIENIGNNSLLRYSSMLYHCYYNMLRLTGNISDLADILRNDVPMNLSSFDLVSASRSLIDSVRHFIGDNQIDVLFDSSEETLIIYADRFKLEKMLLNLIANSLANTQEGGAVRVKLTSAGDRTVLTVNDNGTGIPHDVLPVAWTKFNTPKKLADSPTGVGLGLTLVNNIAHQHGGSAVLQSKPGVGTSVTVSIPIRQPEGTGQKALIDNYDGHSMQQILTELSGVAGFEKYTQQYMD
jgi:signal transduction histidine kinase